MRHLNNFLLKNHQTLIEAISVIEKNNEQIACVVDNEMVLLGIITNGDIRRALVNKIALTDSVEKAMNRNFKSAQKNISHENLLKIFDLGYRAIPIIDDQGKLIDLGSPSLFPALKEGKVLSRAQSPVRISFAGGGSDLSYFFMKYKKGSVLNATIALYAHATLIPNADLKINIISQDLDKEENFDSLDHLMDVKEKSLIAHIVSVIRPDYGFDLYAHSDIPVGSGLGGSSAIVTAVIAAFNEFRIDKWSTREIAELAFQIERLVFSISGGWQDQYASAYGGFNWIEFHEDNNIVHPIRLEPNITCELQECLILCDTKIKHDSSNIHDQQRKDFDEFNNEDEVTKMVDLSSKMYQSLLLGNLNKFGSYLHDAWLIKSNLSSAISNETLNNIYETAIKNGALGGKLLGAGGGGFFLFFVQPQFKMQVSSALKALGCEIKSVFFEQQGVQSWRTKLT